MLHIHTINTSFEDWKKRWHKCIISGEEGALLKRLHKHIRSAEGFKLIICQIGHELSVITHEISASCKEKQR